MGWAAVVSALQLRQQSRLRAAVGCVGRTEHQDAGAEPSRREAVILLHPFPPLAGVSSGMWRGRQQNGNLAAGYTRPSA